MLGIWCHRRGPGVLELQLGFRVVEAHGNGVALHRHALDAQVGGAPHLVQHQFEVFTIYYVGYGGLGYPEDVVPFVVGADAVHLFEVADIACPCGFLAIDVELSEVDGTAVEVGHTGYQIFALPLPIRDGHAASDDGSIAFYAESTVLRTQSQRFVQIIGASTQMQCHFVGFA